MAPIYGGMVKILEDWAIRSQAPNEETDREKEGKRERTPLFLFFALSLSLTGKVQRL
jgi:hypothetical protein